MDRNHRRRYGLLVVAVFAIAIAVRSLPLFHSNLPTPHDFAYIPPTDHIVETGRLAAAGRTDHFFWFTWLASLSLVFDIEPLRVIRPMSAVVGALPTILAVAVTRRLCAHRGWRPRRAWTAAGLAGLFIGIQGLYLYRSMAPHPKTIGLFILPLFVIFLHRAYASGRGSWWISVVVILVVIPPSHVFVSLLTAIIVTILAGIVIVRAHPYRIAAPVVGIAGVLWLYAPGFHYLLRALTPTRVAYTERVTELPDLYLAWIILGVLGTVWFVHARDRAQRALCGALFTALFGLLAINAVTPVFHGAPKTPPIMLAGFGPLVVLTLLASWRVPDATGAARVGPPLVAIVAGTAVIIGITLTSLPTVLHLTTAARASYFLHFPMMVLAGIGGATLLGWTRLPHPTTTRSAIAVGLALCAAVSVPIALAGLPLLPYENATSGSELTAAQFAVERVDGSWATDGQLHDISTRIASDPTAPVYASTVNPANVSVGPIHTWMQSPDTGPPDCPVMGKASWTAGAMFYPLPVERLPNAVYEDHLRTSNVVYHSGAVDDQRLTIQPGGSTAGCQPVRG